MRFPVTSISLCNARRVNKMIGDHRAMILCAAISTEDICHERHKPVMAAYPGISKSTGQDSSENEEAMESAGNDSVIASILGIIGVTGVVTRFRSFETFEDQASLSPRALNPSDGPASATADSGNDKSRSEELPSSHQDAGSSCRPKPDPEKEAQQRIIIAKLPEMERTLVALIRECRKRHLIVTPDALLRGARDGTRRDSQYRHHAPELPAH